MRHLNEYQHHLRVLLEPYDAKVSRTVLRGESPSNGADLLDIYEMNVETDRLLSADAKFTRFLKADNKNVISKSIKHIFV